MSGHEVRLYPASELQCVVDEETGNLGSGSFGTVRLAFHSVLGSVAVKCFPVGNDSPENKIKRELETLNKINHANVLRIFGWSKWSNSMGIIMEYLPGGSMGSVLLNKRANIAPCLRLRMSHEVADGLSFLHNLYNDRKLTHGDMKPDNVVLTKDLHCKIADFGGAEISTCSTVARDRLSLRASEYTLPYAAPERLKNPFLRLHPQQDVYSYGVILHMVLSREYPVPMTGNIDSDVFSKAVQSGNRPDEQEIEDLKSNLKQNRNNEDLELIQAIESEMKRCWDGEIANRPTMVQVRNRLGKLADALDISKVLLSVADTLRGLTIIQPKLEKNQCISLSRLSPPQFVIGEQSDAPSASPRASPSNQETVVQATVVSGNIEPIQKVKADVVLISILLRTNNLKESAAVCEQLEKYLQQTTIRPESCREIVRILVETAGKLTRKMQNRSSLNLLMEASKLCLSIVDPTMKLKTLNSVGDGIEDLVIVLYKQDMESGIKSVAIPLLQAFLKDIQKEKRADEQIYVQALAMCLYYLGRCHVYVKEYDKAIQALTTAIKLRLTKYGSNAGKLSAFGQCYVMLANAERGKGDNSEAEKSLKCAMKVFQQAEDMSTETKRDVIQGLEAQVNKLESAPNMEALIALLTLLN